jgi:hypothetical protein
MTKRKEPQMAHTAEEALAREFDSLIEDGAEGASEEELADRERKFNQSMENVRERVSRQEKA